MKTDTKIDIFHQTINAERQGEIIYWPKEEKTQNHLEISTGIIFKSLNVLVVDVIVKRGDNSP